MKKLLFLFSAILLSIFLNGCGAGDDGGADGITSQAQGAGQSIGDMSGMGDMGDSMNMDSMGDDMNMDMDMDSMGGLGGLPIGGDSMAMDNMDSGDSMDNMDSDNSNMDNMDNDNSNMDMDNMDTSSSDDSTEEGSESDDTGDEVSSELLESAEDLADNDDEEETTTTKKQRRPREKKVTFALLGDVNVTADGTAYELNAIHDFNKEYQVTGYKSGDFPGYLIIQIIGYDVDTKKGTINIDTGSVMFKFQVERSNFIHNGGSYPLIYPKNSQGMLNVTQVVEDRDKFRIVGDVNVNIPREENPRQMFNLSGNFAVILQNLNQ